MKYLTCSLARSRLVTLGLVSQGHVRLSASSPRHVRTLPQPGLNEKHDTNHTSHVMVSRVRLYDFNPLPSPGICASRARGRRDRPAAAEPVPRAPRGRKIAPRHRRNILHIPTSGLYARKGKPGRVAAARRRSSRCGPSRLHHRRTLVPRCPITSPRWPRRPFIRTKASTKRENAVPTPSASNEGQVFKGGESLAADGEQHTGRAVASEGRRERYRWPPYHQIRRSECCHPLSLS